MKVSFFLSTKSWRGRSESIERFWEIRGARTKVVFLCQKYGRKEVVDCVTEVEEITVANGTVESPVLWRRRVNQWREVWKEEESVCLNTGEMLAEITEDNVVGSANVRELYSSLDIAFTVEKVCEVFHTNSVQIVGVNAEELGLYLALNRTEAELRDVGLLQFCPWRRTNRARPPTITGCALDEIRTKRYKPWLPPAEDPDEVTIRN